MMEMHKFDNKIRSALLLKANEIQSSEQSLEEEFTKIIAGLQKPQTCQRIKINSKHYIIVLICAMSLIFGTLFFLSANVRVSALETLNTAKNVLILDKDNNSVNTQESSVNLLSKMGVNPFLLQSLAGCFFINQMYDLELCFRYLVVRRSILGAYWDYNKQFYRQASAY